MKSIFYIFHSRLYCKIYLHSLNEFLHLSFVNYIFCFILFLFNKKSFKCRRCLLKLFWQHWHFMDSQHIVGDVDFDVPDYFKLFGLNFFSLWHGINFFSIILTCSCYHYCFCCYCCQYNQPSDTICTSKYDIWIQFITIHSIHCTLNVSVLFNTKTKITGKNNNQHFLC